MHLVLRKTVASASLLLSGASAFADGPLQRAVISATYGAGGMLSSTDDYAGSNVGALDPHNVYADFFTTDFLFGFDFTPDGNLAIYNNSAVPAGAYVASFDFGASLGKAITGFSVTDAGLTTGTPALSIINDHTIAIDLSGVRWNGDYSALQTSITLRARPTSSRTWRMLAGLLRLGRRVPRGAS